jgi:two-component system sensor kinase
MLLDPRLAELLLRWEQHRIDGVKVPPEELCRNCPELLEEFIEKLLSAQNTLATFFPATPGSFENRITQHGPTGGLPTIGDYQILNELGQGGMGIVYQAFDRKRQEMVALKTLHRIDVSAIYRLKQEFRALAEVTHPNLVGLYELICTEQKYVIAMELIDGDHFLVYVRSGPGPAVPEDGDNDHAQCRQLGRDTENLSSELRNGTHRTILLPHQFERLCSTLAQLVQGILVLHSHGILHRDIKPSNVMVTREGRVVLLDFGLAAELNRDGIHQSTEQHLTGTVAYMSPEQASGRPLSVASDWYSVGVMLYEALTGRLPFSGSIVRMLMEKENREPLAPAAVVDGIPEDLNRLCVELLRSLPEARPAGNDLLQRLTARVMKKPLVRSNSAPVRRTIFVGRDAQLNKLSDVFESVRKGRSALVRLEGRSGAGKSMLAQQFIDGLEQRGAVVLAGKCYERESVPYKTLDSLVDALSRYLRHLPMPESQAILPREAQLLAQVFPILQRVAAFATAPRRVPEIVDPHELRRRAFEALRELLGRLSDRKPLVLFIDDLQWGDVDGATQLAELLRPPDAPVMLLLACYRSEDADTSPCLSILFRAFEKLGTTLDQLTLGVDPLTHEEACELARALLDRRDSAGESLADSIARESRGNAFFVHELVQGINGRMEVAESPTTGVLVLEEVLWARIQSLPAEPRHLLEVIAVSGQPLRLAEARLAAILSHDEHGAVAVLRSGRLIRSIASADLEEVETYHDRIRETILSHLPGELIRDVHRRIAIVLEASLSRSGETLVNQAVDKSFIPSAAAASGDSSSVRNQASKRFFELAYHFDAAGDSARAYPYAIAMADQARSQYALEIAEQLYRIAERGAEHKDNSARFHVTSHLGDVLMLRGRYPEAELRFKAALTLTSDIHAQAQIEGKLAELAFKCGDMKTAVEANERALRMLGNRVPRFSIVYLCFLFREILVQGLHTVSPSQFLAKKHVNGSEKTRLAMRLYNRLTYAYWFGRGKIPCLWAHLQGMNLAERYPPTLELALLYSTHAPVMSLIGNYHRGIAYARKSFAICGSMGNLWGQGQSLQFEGLVLFVASRFDDCIATCYEAIRLLERTGDYWEVNAARYHIAASLYRLGDLPRAIAEATRMRQSGLEIGDIQASGICFDVLVRASGGKVDAEALQTELRRERFDLQGSAQVQLAEGVRLLMLDHPEEAAALLCKAMMEVKMAGMENAWTQPLRPWLASALRRQAEKSSFRTSKERRAILRRAERVAKSALKVARKFQNDLPHALRECGLIATMQGRLTNARQYLDESMLVAERQGARFEYAQTLLARGRVGQEHGWPEAQFDLDKAKQSFRMLGAECSINEPENR